MDMCPDCGYQPGDPKVVSEQLLELTFLKREQELFSKKKVRLILERNKAEQKVRELTKAIEAVKAFLVSCNRRPLSLQDVGQADLWDRMCAAIYGEDK